MKVLIVDDEREMALKVRDDFFNYFKHFEDIEFEIKNDTFSQIAFDTVDIAFVDIDLVTANGINLAQYIKSRFPSVVIIFVSSKEELVFRTFSVSVFQFIRKRKYEQDIKIVFSQLEKHMIENFNKKSLIVNGRKVVVRPDKIKTILSIGHDVILFEEKEYTIKSSIQGILEYLNSPYLIQIQRNLVINFNFIKEVKRQTITTMDDEEYSIGRRYQEEFQTKYEEYLWR